MLSDSTLPPLPGVLIQQAERLLVDRLHLAPVSQPEELAQATGTWKGGPVAITTRAYRSDAIRYARFAELSGDGLAIGNLLVLARPALALPILGADLVRIGDRTMLAADLSPVLAHERRGATIPAVRDALGPLPALPPGGDLPAWCADLFSPHVLYTRVEDPQLATAARAFHRFPAAFVTLAATARPQPDLAAEVAAWHAAYATRHRLEDKGLGLLAKLFGPEWAQRYLTEVLFPDGSGPAPTKGG